MNHQPPNVTALPTAYASAECAITVAGDGRPPLREDWVERIFAVLSAGFGRQFADQWAASDPLEMKALWARKLSGYFDQPQAIRAALDDATSRQFPPNIGEFLAMCQRHYRHRHAAEGQRIPHVGPETYRPDVIERMREVLSGQVSA